MMKQSDQINLTVPQSWEQLSETQLLFIYKLIASGHFTLPEIKIAALFRFSGIKVLSSADGDAEKEYIVKIKKQIISLPVTEIAIWLDELVWLDSFPDFPVRPCYMLGRKAISPTLTELSFECYLATDNLYQGYLKTNDRNLLFRMADFLYVSHKLNYLPSNRKWAKARKSKTTTVPEVAVFYWFAAFKTWSASRWPHFLKLANKDGRQSNFTTGGIREAVDAQIRALTKGDITKESEILQMPCHRALTELNALAKESEELKLKLKSK